MGVPPCPRLNFDLSNLHVVFPSSLKRRQLESNWTRCVVCDTLQFITKLIIFPRNLFVLGILLFTCGESNFLLKLTFTVLLIALYHKLRWILPYFSWETKKQNNWNCIVILVLKLQVNVGFLMTHLSKIALNPTSSHTIWFNCTLKSLYFDS